MKSLFSLTKPAKKPEPLLQESFRPKLLKQWVEAQPSANSGRLLQDLLGQLTIMNGQELSGEERFEGLEMLRSFYYLVFDAHISVIPNNGFPLPEEYLETIQWLNELVRQYASGYWLALEEFDAQAGNRRVNRQVLLAVQRLMLGLYDILFLHCYQHLPAPDWLWMDLHMLISLAEKTGKPQHTFKFDNPRDSLSCIETYKLSALLILSETFGLQQHELLCLNSHLVEWCQRVEFTEKPPASGQAVYFFDLAEDRAPVFGGASGEASNPRFLDLGRLIARIEKSVKPQCSHDSRYERHFCLTAQNEFPLSLGLIEFLQAAWSGKKLQGDVLFENRVPQRLSIGIKVIHHQFNPESGADESKVCETASERALYLNGDPHVPVSIGSLVSYTRADGEDRNLALGVICKISIGRSRGPMVIEIQQLASPLMAAGIQPLSQSDRTYQRALMYNEKTQSGTARSALVISSQRLRNGNKIRLLAPTGPYTVELDHQRTLALGYIAFYCRKLTD